MAYAERIATQFNFENITIYDWYNTETNVTVGYFARPNEGYVMYDPNDDYIDEETGELVRYYKLEAGIPRTFNFDNFPYIAVLRSTIDEDDIANVPDRPETETE